MIAENAPACVQQFRDGVEDVCMSPLVSLLFGDVCDPSLRRLQHGGLGTRQQSNMCLQREQRMRRPIPEPLLLPQNGVALA